MKKYILIDDLYCRFLANSKKDMIEYIKDHMKRPTEYGYIENIKDLEIRQIKYDGIKINVDDFFGDVIAIDRKTGASIDYDDYKKHGIVDGIAKKDFLYHNL